MAADRLIHHSDELTPAHHALIDIIAQELVERYLSETEAGEVAQTIIREKADE